MLAGLGPSGALGEESVPCPPQLLEATPIPWLAVLSSIFKASKLASLPFPSWSRLSLTCPHLLRPLLRTLVISLGPRDDEG